MNSPWKAWFLLCCFNISKYFLGLKRGTEVYLSKLARKVLTQQKAAPPIYIYIASPEVTQVLSYEISK